MINIFFSYKLALYKVIKLFNETHKTEFYTDVHFNPLSKKYRATVTHTDPGFMLMTIEHKNKKQLIKKLYESFLLYLALGTSVNNEFVTLYSIKDIVKLKKNQL